MDTSINGYPQPEWNTASTTSEAMLAISSAKDQKQSTEAYDRLLYALGNNHAGTYYPVALAMLPQLESVLRGGAPWAQRAALNVLIELTGSFEPEPGYERFAGVALAESIYTGVANMRSLIEPIAKEGGVAATSASELLEQIQQK